MFVEKVDKNDFYNFFVNKAGIDIELKNQEDKTIYVRFLLDSYGPSPEFILKDFSCKPLNLFAKMNENEMMRFWEMYLTEKFGKEYTNALNNKEEITK